MRDAVIHGELQHLRVDHDEFALVGREPVQQRQDHGVDADRLARAGGAGNQKMRHAREVDGDELAADILAERKREPGVGLLEVRRFGALGAPRSRAGRWKLYADGVAARHHGDAGGDRAHGPGDVVGKPDHARGFGAGRGLDLVQRDHGAGAHIGDLALDAEILEHAFELPGVFLKHFVADGGSFAGARLLLQELERRGLIGHLAPLHAGAGMLFLLRGARDTIVGLGDVVALLVLLLFLFVVFVGLEIEGRLDAAVRIRLGVLGGAAISSSGSSSAPSPAFRHQKPRLIVAPVCMATCMAAPSEALAHSLGKSLSAAPRAR